MSRPTKGRTSRRVTTPEPERLYVVHTKSRNLAVDAGLACREALHKDRMRRELSPKGQQLLEVMDEIVAADPQEQPRVRQALARIAWARTWSRVRAHLAEHPIIVDGLP